MRAIVLMGHGDVDNLELKEEPDPSPGPNEVMVGVAGASINPIDWKMRSGAAKAMMAHPPPIILGRDVSGKVVKVGKDVTAFKTGDRVIGLAWEAYADFVVAKEDAWAKIPDGLDLVDAAALPLVVLTGTQLVEEAVRPRAGDTVLVTGAVGSVGRAAVFAAQKLGAKVWAGVRGKQKAEASALGASDVVALDDAKDLERLPKVDGIADTVNGETIKALYDKLKPGGTIGSVLGEPQGAKERGLVVRAMRTHPDSKRLGELAKAVADGELRIPIAKRFPLAETGEAQRFAEHGAGGKVVITF
jgi:NADPH:quinone reductase-like Zn-dependent oxidoreductase